VKVTVSINVNVSVGASVNVRVSVRVSVTALGIYIMTEYDGPHASELRPILERAGQG